MTEKEILLKFNGSEKKVLIKNNFKEAKEAIKQSLSLSNKDFEKYKIYYLDEEEDEIEVDEDNPFDTFDDAFAKGYVWKLEPIEEDE